MNRPDESCPACDKPTLTAVATGEQACSDPDCRYAHGFENLDRLLLDLLRRQERARAEWIARRGSEDGFPDWFQRAYGTWIERLPSEEP